MSRIKHTILGALDRVARRLGGRVAAEPIGRAHAKIQHHRRNPVTGRMELVDESETANLINNTGRIFVHQQAYGTSGLGANGLNFIALSNDALTETAASTTLSNEITTNGLARAQGTVTLPTGSGNQTTIQRVFTATGAVSCQKAALFTASSAGTMNHALAFTQKNLGAGDQLTVTFTITLG